MLCCDQISSLFIIVLPWQSWKGSSIGLGGIKKLCLLWLEGKMLLEKKEAEWKLDVLSRLFSTPIKMCLYFCTYGSSSDVCLLPYQFVYLCQSTLKVSSLTFFFMKSLWYCAHAICKVCFPISQNMYVSSFEVIAHNFNYVYQWQK